MYSILKKTDGFLILFLFLITVNVIDNAFSWDAFFIFVLMGLLGTFFYKSTFIKVEKKLLDYSMLFFIMVYGFVLVNFIFFLKEIGIIFVIMFVLGGIILLLLTKTEKITTFKEDLVRTNTHFREDFPFCFAFKKALYGMYFFQLLYANFFGDSLFNPSQLGILSLLVLLNIVLSLMLEITIIQLANDPIREKLLNLCYRCITSSSGICFMVHTVICGNNAEPPKFLLEHIGWARKYQVYSYGYGYNDSFSKSLYEELLKKGWNKDFSLVSNEHGVLDTTKLVSETKKYEEELKPSKPFVSFQGQINTDAYRHYPTPPKKK